jgi:cardiolipin synthase C
MKAGFLIALRASAVLAVLGALAVLALRITYPLPDISARPASTARPPSLETALGRAVLPAMAMHAELSGVVPVRDGLEAFAARVHLVRSAQASIDAQYYIWQADTTGILLLDELRVAAERGVRVRLLVDDNGIPGLDRELAALDALPAMEVRLFNPFTLRDPKILAYTFDFPRLNRRMHNKSLTADGLVSVIGGRNIGDIYFAFGTDAHYIDMDVLAAGPAAADVSADFDRYWASASAYPAGLILPAAPEGLDLLRGAAEVARGAPTAEPYLRAIAETPLVGSLLEGTLPLEWVPVTLISDDPAKGLDEAAQDDLLVSRLIEILATPREQVELVSAYFAPGDRGAGLLTALAERGVRVRVLTNALEATDVPLVHGGYAEARPALLAAGVELYELRAGPDAAAPAERFGLPGSTATSLHSKTFAFDRGSVFVGSFNFDPRSARLNTEMGFLIESPAIAAGVTAEVDAVPEGAAYVVGLNGGDLEWRLTGPDGATVVYDVEPNTSFTVRLLVGLVGLLPIGWML